MNSLNRYLMTPLLRMGLGPLLANPVSGYLMLLRTTGRRSGKARYAPMNYAIIDGVVYCIAAWGKASSWHANLVADPRVEAILPGGVIAGIAEDVTDPTEWERALVQVARNAGLAVLFDGVNPRSATDRQLVARVGEGARVVRIRPTGLGNGPHDPHGLAWIPSTLAWGALAAYAWNRRRRAGKGDQRSHRGVSEPDAGAEEQP